MLVMAMEVSRISVILVKELDKSLLVYFFLKPAILVVARGISKKPVIFAKEQVKFAAKPPFFNRSR